MGVTEDILQNDILPFAWRINYLANYYSLKANRELQKKYHTSRQEFVVLFCLTNSSNVTAQDICNVTGRPKNTISDAVSKLLKKGYISRRDNPRDGRSGILRLTAKGSRLYERIIEIFKEQEIKMVAGLKTTERKALDRILAKLIQNFNPPEKG
jgi:DNA-binding MarR family transcriptional regulator